jgi:hypothetical protein
MKITLIGKKGCTKCSKMAFILESKGHTITTVYPENSGVVEGVQINIVEGMHFPLYIVNQKLIENFKDLNQLLTPIPEAVFNPRSEEP